MINSFYKTKLPVITVVIAILAVLFMRFVLGFDGLYGQDGYEYLRYAHALKLFITDGTDPGDYFWPVWYPLLGALLSFIVQDVALSLQLISCISLTIVFVYFNKTIQLVFNPVNCQPSVVFSLLFVVLSPFMLRFGLLVMADMLTLAFITISTYYFLLSAKKGKTVHLILGGLIGTLACMTRYAAVAILAPIAIYSYWSFFKNSKNSFNAIPAFILAFIPVIPHILIRGTQSTTFIQHDWVSQWSLFNFFKNDFRTRDGFASNALPNILYAFGGLFHPRYCFIAILILLIGFKKIKVKPEVIIISTGLIVYLIFLAGIPYQNNRFLVIALPYLLFILYNPWESLIQARTKRITMMIVGLVFIIQAILFPFAFKAVYMRNAFEKELYAYMIGQGSPPIYTMDVDISLKGRGYPSHIYNIYQGVYPNPENTGYVIFHHRLMNDQWYGQNPMTNWGHFTIRNKLVEIKKYNNGWTIYKFE